MSTHPDFINCKMPSRDSHINKALCLLGPARTLQNHLKGFSVKPKWQWKKGGGGSKDCSF